MHEFQLASENHLNHWFSLEPLAYDTSPSNEQQRKLPATGPLLTTKTTNKNGIEASYEYRQIAPKKNNAYSFYSYFLLTNEFKSLFFSISADFINGKKFNCLLSKRCHKLLCYVFIAAQRHLKQCRVPIHSSPSTSPSSQSFTILTVYANNLLFVEKATYATSVDKPAAKMTELTHGPLNAPGWETMTEASSATDAVSTPERWALRTAL